MRYWDRVEQIQSRLGNRKLVYFGTRGTDARPLLNLGLLDAVFCQIAPLQVPGVEEVCMETLKGVRVDLNSYSIDKDPSPEVKILRDRMLQRFGRPAAVVPYRPAELLTATWFPRAGRVTYLGVFHEKQSYFEHKPWVEEQLDARGIPVLPWRYYSDADRVLIKEALNVGPLVLRANRSDGGAGLGILREPGQLEERWPVHEDGFLAAAPFLFPSIPLNVNACVFRSGAVALHPPSVQLIGTKECTNRPFGYCGNDFSWLRELGHSALNQLEAITREAGRWLSEEGYVGAFGVDALLYEEKVYLVEINPRFQGSSVVAATIMKKLGLPDVFLDHIAACLNLNEPRNTMNLIDLAHEQAEIAEGHIVCYNTASNAIQATSVLDDPGPLCEFIPSSQHRVEVEGALFALRLTGRLTSNGGTLTRATQDNLLKLRHTYFPCLGQQE